MYFTNTLQLIKAQKSIIVFMYEYRRYWNAKHAKNLVNNSITIFWNIIRSQSKFISSSEKRQAFRVSVKCKPPKTSKASKIEKKNVLKSECKLGKVIKIKLLQNQREKSLQIIDFIGIFYRRNIRNILKHFIWIEFDWWWYRNNFFIDSFLKFF